MSAEISRYRLPSGFDLYEWLMLIVAVTTATVMFVLLRDPIPETGTLAENIMMILALTSSLKTLGALNF
jgi:hypothetical protein